MPIPQWVEIIPIDKRRPAEFRTQISYNEKSAVRVRQWYFHKVDDLKDVEFQIIKSSSTLRKVAKIGDAAGEMKPDLFWWLLNTNNERSLQIRQMKEFCNRLHH